MEESIKIVEEILDGLKANRVHGQFTEEQFMKENQAIEQLIKGYRELEESNKTLQDAYWNKCIPKSKIKEKIEEYQQEMKEIRAENTGLIWNHRLHKLDYAIEVLQELINK